MIWSRVDAGVARPRCGRELRSVSGSSRAARPTHSLPRRSLIPAASDAARTDHPCSETRLNSRTRLAGQLRAFLWMFIRALPVNLFVLRAFRLTKVARMSNPLQGTTSWHITPNDPDENHTRKKKQKQQRGDEEPNDEIPRSGDCVGVSDPFSNEIVSEIAAPLRLEADPLMHPAHTSPIRVRMEARPSSSKSSVKNRNKDGGRRHGVGVDKLRPSHGRRLRSAASPGKTGPGFGTGLRSERHQLDELTPLRNGSCEPRRVARTYYRISRAIHEGPSYDSGTARPISSRRRTLLRSNCRRK
jgi:hypothetical protein